MSEKQKRGSHINCCVYGCHTYKGRDKHLSYHNFPKAGASSVFITTRMGLCEKVDRKRAWEIKLLMGKPVSPFMRVCSLHFTRDDFILPDIPTKFPRLKRTSVPSQNLPVKSGKKETIKCRRQIHRQQTVSRPEDSAVPSTSTDAASAEVKPQLADDETSVLQLLNLPKQTCEKSVQVKSGDIAVPFITTINTDAKLSSLTGLPSFLMLELLVELVTKHFEDTRVHKLSIKERIILTFMKMKTGLRYVVLAALFGSVTSKTCNLIFREMILKLTTVLKPVIAWPSAEQCKQNLPLCFETFPSVRLVLDCTEITLQKPSKLCCRILSYSHYKGTQTIKFMTGVSPAGLVTFISAAYRGRTSDNAIFEQSGLVKKLNMGVDSIMVDKGFRTENITDAHHIKLIRPPFLKNKKQLSEEEAVQNAAIARARVHIERSNQRIKVFEIFIKPLPVSLVPIITDIFTVACAIVNLSVPILKDDKFVK